jgi:hypothetical protein
MQSPIAWPKDSRSCCRCSMSSQSTKERERHRQCTAGAHAHRAGADRVWCSSPTYVALSSSRYSGSMAMMNNMRASGLPCRSPWPCLIRVELEEVLPSDVGERLCHIQLDEQHRCLQAVEMFNGSLNALEIVVDAAPPDKRALTVRDDSVQVWC